MCSRRWKSWIALRLHLDAADEQNGALFVSPGSHRLGRLPEAAIAAAIDGHPVIACQAAPGDVLAFRPLLLHMSRKSIHAEHRRVVQIEYAAARLPTPLAWFEQDAP